MRKKGRKPSLFAPPKLNPSFLAKPLSALLASPNPPSTGSNSFRLGQQVTPRFTRGIFLPGIGENLFYKADGRKNTIRRQPDEVTWVMQCGVDQTCACL